MQRKRVDVHHHYHSADSEDKPVLRKDCAWCKGTGKVREIITGREKKCDVCGGEGRNSFRPPVEQCRPCSGTGVSGRTLVMSSRINVLSVREKAGAKFKVKCHYRTHKNKRVLW